MNRQFKLGTVAAGIALALAGTAGQASHFRGAAMIPTIDANGVLTVVTTSFWRNGAVNDHFASVSGGAVQTSATTPVANDTSDSRFTRRVNQQTFQLPGAGTFNLTSSSCCRVAGIQNFPGGNSSTSWTMNSSIVWDGSNATSPIAFNFNAIQPEVVRGANYNGTLGAVGGPGLTLTYDQALNPSIPAQPPGFTIDPNTGALHIPAANTATYLDNTSGNPGADYSFSGNIFARTGAGALVGQVEFEWLFDAVNTGSGNLAPQGNDVIINALLGSTVNHTFTATDDGNPIPPGALTWSFVGFLGSGVVNAPTFDPTTQQFSWNSAGTPAGQYVAQVLVSDGSLTDIVLATINLGRQPPPGAVPEPATLSLLGLALAGLGLSARRRSRKR